MKLLLDQAEALKNHSSLAAEDIGRGETGQELETTKSITTDLAIETIQLLLQRKYDEMKNRLGQAEVLELLKFCLRTYFAFDGTIYEQVKGTPMGSPISGLIAEAVRLAGFLHHRPKFCARYVDDTFDVIDRDQLLTFKEHVNVVFPDIKFTMEEEVNNQLVFLDVLPLVHEPPVPAFVSDDGFEEESETSG
ncbi:hypothetical protein SprV_0301344200 [Sparganum proliferum]